MNINPTGKDFRAAAANFITGKAAIKDLQTMHDRVGQTLTEPLTPKPLNLKDLSTGQKLTTIFFWGIKTQFPLYLIPQALQSVLEKLIAKEKAKINDQPVSENKVAELAEHAKAQLAKDTKKAFDEAQTLKDEAQALKIRQLTPENLEKRWQQVEAEIKQAKELGSRDKLAELVKERKELEALMVFEEVDLGPLHPEQKLRALYEELNSKEEFLSKIKPEHLMILKDRGIGFDDVSDAVASALAILGDNKAASAITKEDKKTWGMDEVKEPLKTIKKEINEARKIEKKDDAPQGFKNIDSQVPIDKRTNLPWDGQI